MRKKEKERKERDTDYPLLYLHGQYVTVTTVMLSYICEVARQFYSRSVTHYIPVSIVVNLIILLGGLSFGVIHSYRGAPSQLSEDTARKLK